MTQTTFLMSSSSARTRCRCTCAARAARGRRRDLDWSQEPEWWAGGHGLYSTPRDYLKFQRMLLGGGTLDDARDPRDRRPLDEAFTNQIGDARLPARHRDRGPGQLRPTSTPARATSSASAAAQQRGPARRAAGRERRVGGHLQHALLGRPQHRRDRRDLLPDAAVRGAARVPDVRRLRARAVRLARAGLGQEQALRARRRRRSRSRPRAAARSAAARGPARRACRPRA